MTASSDPIASGPIALELPPARTEPLDKDGGVFAKMPYRERFLARRLLADEEVFHFVATRTKIDVGSWFLRGRVWVFALADALALIACGSCGRSCRAEKIPYDLLRESQYNHVTGQLAFAPVKGLGFRGLATDPLDGVRILAQIYRED